MIIKIHSFPISGAADVNISKTYFSKNADNNGKEAAIIINTKYKKIIPPLD